MDRGSVDKGWRPFGVDPFEIDWKALSSPSVAPGPRIQVTRDIEAFDLDWNRKGPDKPPKSWLGIDVGFVFPAVDSDGRIYRWARTSPHLFEGNSEIGSPVRIRKADGSGYTQAAYDSDQLADINARARGVNRRQSTRRLASYIVKKASGSGRGIALEDWSDFRRRRAAWVDLWKNIMYLATERGVPFCTVPSAWTSTTCPECGHQERGNRPTRNRFRCKACGHSGQADHIAAQNIMAKAGISMVRESLGACANPACDRALYRYGLCCACYFYMRRHERLPSRAKLDELRAAANYAEMKFDWLAGSLTEARSSGKR